MVKILFASLIAVSGIAGCAAFQAPKPIDQAAGQNDWRAAEKGILDDYVQLTFSDRFVKAGESYFSPDDSKIIFQAVEKPAEGQKPDEFYAMYVADVERDAATGRIAGIDHIKRISPSGSANTCGWFHPTQPNVVIFASTLTTPKPPTENEAHRSGAYKWPFPPEMRIVQCDLKKADGTAASLKEVGGYANQYQAEGSISPDGRFLLFCSTESNEGDIFVLDLKTQKKTRLVQARGYDGGPFFSPDGKRICYRSDRENDSLLQIFVGDLAFNPQGEIVGISREYQLTDQPCVNWCPFWTKDGRRLIYASSELGEQNFEIYMMDADPGNLSGSAGTIKYGTAKRRLTHFDQAGGGNPASDVLPAFSHDGKWMIWTSRRGPDNQVQLWAARFVLDPDAPWKSSSHQQEMTAEHADENQIVVKDPDNGRIFIYDMGKHVLSEYNPRTHALTHVEDPADIERFRKLYDEQEGGK